MRGALQAYGSRPPHEFLCKLKTDVAVADYAQCDGIVRQLDLKRFTWAESNVPYIADKSKLGWIAQDVAPIFPKAITVVPEQYGLSNVLNVNFDQVYAVMYGAIRQLQTQVEDLRAEVKTLKAKAEADAAPVV